MPRPDFNVALKSSQTYKGFPNDDPITQLVTIASSQETSGGVSRRKPEGWIPPTPYDYFHVIRRGGYGTKEVSRVDPGGKIGYRYTGTVLTDSQMTPYGVEACCNSALDDSLVSLRHDLGDAALITALQNLKGQKVNLGVAFGERRQTARMLGDTATRLLQAMKQVKRGRVKDAMRTLGISANHRAPRGSNWTKNWLGLQYGWKPLLSDVYGAAEALSKLPGDQWRVTARGRRSETTQKSYLVKPSGGSSTGFRVSAKMEQKAFVRVDALSSNVLASTFSSLGVTNPLEVAWELVPLSFLADWALPIGDWLSTLDAYLGYENITVCRSLLTKADWTVSGVSGKLSNGFTVVNEFEGTKKKVWLNRTVTGAVAPPFPRFKDPRSLGHMANALSLLSQFLAKP